MRTIDGQNFLTPAEVAERLDISRRTVIRWLSEKRNTALGKVRVVKDPINGYNYFAEDSIDRLVEVFSRNVKLGR